MRKINTLEKEDYKMSILLAMLNAISNIVVFIMAIPHFKKYYPVVKIWFFKKYWYRKEDKNWDELTLNEEEFIKSILPKYISYIHYIPLGKAIDKSIQLLNIKYNDAEKYYLNIMNVHSKIDKKRWAYSSPSFNPDPKFDSLSIGDILKNPDLKKINQRENCFKIGSSVKDAYNVIGSMMLVVTSEKKGIKESISILEGIKNRLNL